LEWLEFNYWGLISVDEARRDLFAIAGARTRNRAHVLVDPDEGPSDFRTGTVTAAPAHDGAFHVFVDGDPVFDFDPRSFRGAWLTTLDGADYYTLDLDLGWGRVELSDAYNTRTS
jgi:hypothetical protein